MSNELPEELRTGNAKMDLLAGIAYAKEMRMREKPEKRQMIGISGLVKEKKYNKYGVSPKDLRTCDNVVFDSAGEMRRYKQLKLLQQAGGICNLQLQPRYLLQDEFELEGKKYLPIYYVADFSYLDKRSGEEYIEDYKSKATATQSFKVKLKLFLFKYRPRHFRLVSREEVS